MENDHLTNWSEVKILKVEHDYSQHFFTEKANLVYQKKASSARQKRSISISCCLKKVAKFPVLKFLV